MQFYSNEEAQGSDSAEEIRQLILSKLNSAKGNDLMLLKDIYSTLQKRQDEEKTQRQIRNYIHIVPKQPQNNKQDSVQAPPKKQPENNKAADPNRLHKSKRKKSSKIKNPINSEKHKSKMSSSEEDSKNKQRPDSVSHTAQANTVIDPVTVTSHNQASSKSVASNTDAEKKQFLIGLEKWFQPSFKPQTKNKTEAVKKVVCVGAADFDTQLRLSAFQQALKKLHPTRTRSKGKERETYRFVYPRGHKAPQPIQIKNSLEAAEQAENRSRSKSRRQPSKKQVSDYRKEKQTFMLIWDSRLFLRDFKVLQDFRIDYTNPLSKVEALSYDIDSEEQLNELGGEDVNRQSDSENDSLQGADEDDFKKYFVPDGYLSQAEVSEKDCKHQLHPRTSVQAAAEWLFSPKHQTQNTLVTEAVAVALHLPSEFPLKMAPPDPQELLDRKYGIKSVAIQATVDGNSRAKVIESLTKDFGFDKKEAQNWIKIKMKKKKVEGKVTYLHKSKEEGGGVNEEEQVDEQTCTQARTQV